MLGEHAEEAAPAAAAPAAAAAPEAEPILSSEGGDGAAGPANPPASSSFVEKLREVGGKVTQHESVQKAMQFVADKSKVVQEKAQAVRQEVAQKVAENESVQKGVQFVVDKSKVVTEKVAERTMQGLEFAKEKTQAVRAQVGTVWGKGKGTIQKVRTEGVSAIAWRGKARDTLEATAREEQWKNIRIQGAEEMSIPARTEHTSAYHVTKGSTLRWTFRVKDYDIGFSVRSRVQEWGGSKEEEVLGVERYDNADTISGSWVADEDRTMILAFDNTYSRLRAKTIAYMVGTEKPPVLSEAPVESNEVPEAAAASSSAPAPGPPIV